MTYEQAQTRYELALAELRAAREALVLAETEMDAASDDLASRERKPGIPAVTP